MVKYGMVIDLKMCVGCDACTVACSMENQTPAGVFWAPVIHQEVGKYPHAKIAFLPTLCMHCDDPACMKGCPTKAIRKRKDGIVIIDQDVCAGHGACVSACPYGAITLYEVERTQYKGAVTPQDEAAKKRWKLRTAQKCTFNHKSVDQGLNPACVTVCPTQCRTFGDLDDPNSWPNRHVKERNQTPMALRPEANTGPNVRYLK